MSRTNIFESIINGVVESFSVKKGMQIIPSSQHKKADAGKKTAEPVVFEVSDLERAGLHKSARTFGTNGFFKHR